jgi:transcriptional regulator with XRE-family HTH domain
MKKEKDDLLDGIGFMLRLSRKKRRLTRKEIAEKAGINLKHLGKIERGESNITIKNLEMFCNVLGISMPNLLQRALGHKMAKFAGRKRLAPLSQIDRSKRDKK